MVTAPTAIIDACVLYSAPIRDLIVRIAQAGLIQARWSNEIHEEWMRSLLNNNPRVSQARLERTRYLMNGALRDCVVTGHMQIVDSLTLADPQDRHILAAAVHATPVYDRMGKEIFTKIVCIAYANVWSSRASFSPRLDPQKETP
jgi:hypothetical protein